MHHVQDLSKHASMNQAQGLEAVCMPDHHLPWNYGKLDHSMIAEVSEGLRKRAAPKTILAIRS